MPCWEINTVRVEWRQKNAREIVAAAKDVGLDTRVVAGVIQFIDGGRVIATIRGDNAEVERDCVERVRQVQQRYSERLVERTARARGWRVRRQGRKLLVTRR